MLDPCFGIAAISFGTLEVQAMAFDIAEVSLADYVPEGRKACCVNGCLGHVVYGGKLQTSRDNAKNHDQ